VTVYRDPRKGDLDTTVLGDDIVARLRYDNWLRRVWRPAVEAAGVPALRYHDLRRTAATDMVAAGVDVRTEPGPPRPRRPPVTLAIYAQVVSDADRHAAHQLQALLMEPPTNGGDQSALGSQ